MDSGGKVGGRAPFHVPQGDSIAFDFPCNIHIRVTNGIAPRSPVHKSAGSFADGCTMRGVAGASGAELI
jgi:hypothetical protein